MFARESPAGPAQGLFRAIVEAQTDLISVARRAGVLVYVNPAFARFLGRSQEQLIGTDLFSLIPEPNTSIVRTAFEHVAATGQARSDEVCAITLSGESSWFLWMTTAQREGDTLLLHSVGRDITAQKQAEIALRESQAVLARTGRVAGVGGWQVDLRTQLSVWTDETYRIFGVEADQAPTVASALEFFPPAARPAMQQAVDHALASGQPWDLELPFTDATGHQLWVRSQGEAEFQDGAAVRLIGAIQDISDRKALEQALSTSEAFVRGVTDNLPLRIAYVDRARRYRFVNLPACKRFGLAREQVIGQRIDDVMPAATLVAIEARIGGVLAGSIQHYELEEMLDGAPHRFETQLFPDLDEDGAVRGMFEVGVDITERSRSEHALRELTREAQRQADILRLVAEALPASVMVVDSEGRYRFVNSAFEAACGRAREQILGRPVAEVLGDREAERRAPFMARAFAGESVVFALDYPDPESTRWMELSYVPLRQGNGLMDGFLCIAQDVTAQRREQSRLTELSQRDPLTGLLNRAGFELRLAQRGAAPGGAGLALLYIDLDFFKRVNDRHGHPVGDRLLRQVAQRLSSLVRAGDAVARLGGDEFAVLLPEVTARADAEAVAGAVVAAIGAPFDVDGHVLQIGASVGVAFGDEPPDDWHRLIESADAGLYRAKAAGRGRHARAEG